MNRSKNNNGKLKPASPVERNIRRRIPVCIPRKNPDLYIGSIVYKRMNDRYKNGFCWKRRCQHIDRVIVDLVIRANKTGELKNTQAIIAGYTKAADIEGIVSETGIGCWKKNVPEGCNAFLSCWNGNPLIEMD